VFFFFSEQILFITLNVNHSNSFVKVNNDKYLGIH